MKSTLITMTLLCTLNAHAALRPGSGGGTTPKPTAPPPTNPVPITGGGSPTATCPTFPEIPCGR